MLVSRLFQREWLRAWASIAIVIGLAFAAKVVLVGLDGAGVYTFSTPFPSVLLGAIVGMTYGLLAIGLVMIYRTNRIINFAHGQIGAFGAAVLGVIVTRYGVPYWLSFPVALLAAAAMGVVAEVAVVRRLRAAPRIVSVVATLGFGQFLLLFAAVVNSTLTSGATFPNPSWFPKFNVGALLVTPAYSAMLFLAPLLVLGLALFFRYSAFGLGLRSAAANPDAARLSGIFASRMSSLAWAMAGALSGFSAILTQPTQGYVSPQTFGPGLLLRALAAAALARMESIPIALAAGVGLGILEQVLLWNNNHAGVVEAALFVIIMVTLLFQRRRFGRDEEKGSWAAVQALRPIPAALQRIWLVRNLGRVAAAIAFAVILALPLVISYPSAANVTGIMAFSIVGLSVGLLTGLGGQLTLGQFAVGAVGAVIAVHFSDRTGHFGLAILYGSVGAALVSLLIGLPALRLRGLMLTVTTLSFALATESWVLGEPWALGAGRDPKTPTFFGQTLSTAKSYYYLAAVLLALAVIVTWNVRRSGFGRLLVAVRDNEEAARAFTVRTHIVKMQAYLLGGCIAGVGGAVFGYSLTRLHATTFPAAASIDVVVMTVLGGVSILIGPILGALYVLGIPAFIHLDSAGLASTQLGALLLILFTPAGLAALAGRGRDRLVNAIARRSGVDVEAVYAGAAIPATTATPELVAHARMPATVGAKGHHVSVRVARHGPLLEARGLAKHFGGVVAVDDVSFTVTRGETLGLIGPNGAGKTTTFELLAGFTPPDRGTVTFDGHDVSWVSPEGRARLGLVRSFQDAALFPTMTVFDVVQLALEGPMPTSFLGSVLGISPGTRVKAARARNLVEFFGLDRFADNTIQELSTGMRRITEIACLIAAEPTLLLLDEPSSGVAQRETEALGQLLTDLKAQFGLTMVIIEHDIPLIMGISDRIVAMADGRVIAAGTPEEVRADALVVEAYLGGDAQAIARSGVAAGAGASAVPALPLVGGRR